MFDELNKYKETDHFFLKPSDSLVKVCNAPEKKAGVYIIFALKNGKIELVQIGSSNENEGIRDQIIREQFFLKGKMKQENIEALDIYWYVTQTSKAINDPVKIKAQVLKTHQGFYGREPRWNRFD
jgi:hypothetical protein